MIELLSVVAVIGLLMALLLPQADKMMETARRSECNSKLRALGGAFATYAADNGGVIPCVMTKSNQGTNPSGGNWLMELSGYVNPDGAVTDNDLIHDYSVCPTYIKKAGRDPTWADWKGGYGMNYTLYRPIGDNGEQTKKERVTLASVPAPSQNILAADCGPSVGLVSNPDGTFLKDGGSLTGFTGAAPDRHNGRANYLFVDGHTENLAPKDASEFLRARQ